MKYFYMWLAWFKKTDVVGKVLGVIGGRNDRQSKK